MRTTLLLLSLTLPALPQAVPPRPRSGSKPVPPDKFVEAMVYAGYARDAFDCKSERPSPDPAAEGVKWTKEALSALRQYKPKDLSSKRRKAEQLKRLDKDLKTFQHWEKLLRDSSREIVKALDEGYLSKAEARLPRDPPACDPRFGPLAARVREKRRIFDNYVRHGDAVFPSDAKRALRMYEQALAIDRSNKEVQKKVRRAFNAS